jgi:hypothetical protein
MRRSIAAVAMAVLCLVAGARAIEEESTVVSAARRPIVVARYDTLAVDAEHNPYQSAYYRATQNAWYNREHEVERARAELEATAAAGAAALAAEAAENEVAEAGSLGQYQLAQRAHAREMAIAEHLLSFHTKVSGAYGRTAQHANDVQDVVEEEVAEALQRLTPANRESILV